MMALLNWSILIAQVLLGLAMACTAYRILRGPRAQDRVLALDTLYVNAATLMLTLLRIWWLERLRNSPR